MQVLKLPEIGGRFLADGTEPNGTSAAEFGSRIAKEIAKWREITQKAGIRLE